MAVIVETCNFCANGCSKHYCVFRRILMSSERSGKCLRQELEPPVKRLLCFVVSKQPVVCCSGRDEAYPAVRETKCQLFQRTSTISRTLTFIFVCRSEWLGHRTDCLRVDDRGSVPDRETRVFVFCAVSRYMGSFYGGKSAGE
jgi:hypothetical protein